MKYLITACSAASLLLCLAAHADNLSYAMGFKTGQALKTQLVTINPATFSQGLDDGYAGKQPNVSEEKMQIAIINMQNQMAQNMKQQYQNMAQKNKMEGEAFLKKNAKIPGIKTTASGLQYQIIDEGKGESPTVNDSVTVDYEGKSINGKIFDSSYQRKKPTTFKVGDVIKGWQEALTMMKPGATWILYIPSELAYGAQGAMGAIGPNETLIFRVHLISVKK